MYKIEKNQRVPDYINLKASNFEIACMDGKILIYIKDCQGPQDAVNFEQSNIRFSVSIIEGISFFIIDVDKCELICDVPFDFHKLPTIDDVFPIEDVYLIFVDNDRTIRAMRGMTLANDKLSNLLLSTLHSPLEKETNILIQEIYEKYPQTALLEKVNNYSIQWSKPTNFA